MENKNTQSKHVVDAGQLFKMLVIVAALLCLLYVAYRLGGFNKVKPTVTPQPAQVQKTNVDFSKTPEKFPANIPLEANARTTQNFNATTPDGVFQAVRTFVTGKSLADNLALYTDFLKKDGWTIKGTLDNPTYKMIIGAKDKSNIQISIDENKVTKERTVSVSYSETK